MESENILYVDQDKLEVADTKFRNQRYRKATLDVSNLGTNPTDHHVHFTFAGSDLEEDTRMFVQSDLSANSFVTEEQYPCNDLKNELLNDSEGIMTLAIPLDDIIIRQNTSSNLSQIINLSIFIIDWNKTNLNQKENRGEQKDQQSIDDKERMSEISVLKDSPNLRSNINNNNYFQTISTIFSLLQQQLRSFYIIIMIVIITHLLSQTIISHIFATQQQQHKYQYNKNNNMNLILITIIIYSIQQEFFNTSGIDTNSCSEQSKCRTLDADNIKNIVNNINTALSNHQSLFIDTMPTNVFKDYYINANSGIDNPLCGVEQNPCQSIKYVLNFDGTQIVGYNLDLDTITIILTTSTTLEDNIQINSLQPFGYQVQIKSLGYNPSLNSYTKQQIQTQSKNNSLFIITDTGNLKLLGLHFDNLNPTSQNPLISIFSDNNIQIPKLSISDCEFQQYSLPYSPQNLSHCLLSINGGQLTINQTTIKIYKIGNGKSLIMIKSDETNSAGAFRKNVIEISNSTFQNITQSESGNGTAINAELKTGSLLKIADQSQFTYCVSSSGNGGGICLIIFGGTAELSGVTINYCNGTNGGGIFISVISEISVELSNISFNNCSAVNGGGIYSNINAGGKLIFKDSCKFSQCKASSGNGGGMYIDIDFASQFEFKIIDALIKQCQAQSDSSYSYPTGYGGGIFLTGNGDYNPLTLRLDLKGMQIYNNIASKGGQSLYVVMTKVAEWCRYGISGKYVKGNYSDGISIKIVLQGIPVNSSTFNSYTLTQITSQQNYLEDYWKVDWAEYYTQSTGNDSSPCSSTTPCKTFEAANIKNNINSETSIHIYVYDSASIEDTIIISQTYSPRIFRNFPLDSTLLSDILIKADGKFIITVKVLFQLINFIIESISLQQFVPGIYGSSLTAEINLQECQFHMQNAGTQIRKCFIYLEKGGNHAISNLISKYVQSEENIIRINFNEAGSLNISESQFENITRIGEQITGGTIRAVLQHSSNRFNITDCNFTTCKAQDSQGGAIYAEILNSNAQISITRTQFLQCEAQSGGGLFAKILIDGKLILEDSCEFRQCKATSGNGGGIYADLTFKASTQASFLISDALFQNCQAITSSSVPSSTGFGGGIFLIGNGDYDPSTLRLDLKGMKIYNNTANNGGQSLYVMMTKLAEWCRYGILGEYVKGNYSDGISNLNELEGTIMEINIFQNSSQQQIQTQKYHLQYLWTQIPILTEVEVTLNISNTNEPLQFTIKGNNMIPGKLCVKIVDVGPRKSVNEKFQMQQYDAFEYIYPPYDSSTPITVIGIPQTEQIATFGMKDYMWFDYKNENYYIFISNDRQIFTGYEGKEDSGAFLDVIELKDGSSFPIWKIVLIVVICFVIIIAIVFAIFFLYKLKGEKDKKQDKMQMQNIYQSQREEYYFPLQTQSSRQLDSTLSYINQGQTQTLDQNAPFNTTWEKSDFEKVKKLGKGAFSTVWCMKEKSTQRVFAVKVVDFDTQQEQESILKERDILLSIYQTILNSGSPTQYIHVVQPLGFFLNEDEDSYRAYLVLEYCSRGDLRKYIQNMKKSGTEISDRRAFELIAQIISAVHQLHANSIIHGDLKPENVLVMEDYKIKLSDFGLARKIQEGRDYLTAMGGTTPYLGPELLQKKVESNSYQQDENATSVQKRLIQTPASDIWAVGTMMFELLAQHHPFFDNNGGDIPLLELVRRITEEQPAELPSHYSDNLRKLIKDMLTKDPSRRITSEDILEIPEVAEFLTNN